MSMTLYILITIEHYPLINLIFSQWDQPHYLMIVTLNILILLVTDFTLNDCSL